jgi:hypothetical protein
MVGKCGQAPASLDRPAAFVDQSGRKSYKGPATIWGVGAGPWWRDVAALRRRGCSRLGGGGLGGFGRGAGGLAPVQGQG